jgi:Ca2+-binding RTX toxin-like protein
VVDLAAGTGQGDDAEGDTYTGIENVIGTAESDIIIGDGAANRLEGRGGEDYLEGGGGNDTLIGGGEDDYLLGGAGADSIDGAGGSDDWASYEDSTAAVQIDLTLETAQKSGGYGNGDVLVSIANLVGSDFSDKLIGDGQDNKIEGGDGADFIDGGEGFDYVLYYNSDAAVVINFNNSGPQSGGHAQGDILAESEGVVGSDFNDRLIGDGEANGLYGNGGADTLTGGALNDIFGFNTIGDGVDVVTDFQVGAGGDVLHIGNLLTGYNGDINDFVRIVSSGGQTVLQIDTDGGGDSFQDCAILIGVSSGVSVDALLDNGQINPLPGTI